MGPNKYQSFKQGCFQLSIEEPGTGATGDKLFEEQYNQNQTKCAGAPATDFEE